MGQIQKLNIVFDIILPVLEILFRQKPRDGGHSRESDNQGGHNDRGGIGGDEHGDGHADGRNDRGRKP